MNLDKEAEQYAYRAYLLRKEEDDDMATVNYSSVLICKKEYAKAIEVLEAEKAVDSRNYLVYNNLGYSYFFTERFENALENYNISIFLEEKNPLA